MSRPLRVFLCHASQDKPAVWKLHRYLKQHGVQPWLDQEDLLPGQNWEVEIPKALFSSDVILVCLSKNSVDKEGYVQKEISFALDKALEKPEGTIFIIPVKLEECDIPPRLGRYQWVDLSRTDGRKRVLLSLNKRATELDSDVTSIYLEDKRQRNIAPGSVASETKKEGEQIDTVFHNELLEETYSFLSVQRRGGDVRMSEAKEETRPLIGTGDVESAIIKDGNNARNGISRTIAQPAEPYKIISQRGLLSVLMLILSISTLTAALGGGGKLILDLLSEGLMGISSSLWAKTIVLVLAYIFGWLAAAVSIRVYANLILPVIIKVYAWATLVGVSMLYIIILQRLFKQLYDLQHYLTYFVIIVVGLVALVGLHLLLEERDLRPYAIPWFVINLGQFGLIVFRYIFMDPVKANYLITDLLFLFAMTTFSILAAAHFGILKNLRRSVKKLLDVSSKEIFTRL